jgi:hypothetical protein
MLADTRADGTPAAVACTAGPGLTLAVAEGHPVAGKFRHRQGPGSTATATAAPLSTDGELPAADEEAIFKHYGLAYQAGASGERQLARR